MKGPPAPRRRRTPSYPPFAGSGRGPGGAATGPCRRAEGAARERDTLEGPVGRGGPVRPPSVASCQGGMAPCPRSDLAIRRGRVLLCHRHGRNPVNKAELVSAIAKRAD